MTPSLSWAPLTAALGVGQVRSPVGGALGDGEVGHEVIRRGAVPVLSRSARSAERLGRATPGHLPCGGCSAPGPAGFDRVRVMATGLEFVCYLEFPPGRPGKACAGVPQLWPLLPHCHRLNVQSISTR
jgi:hypothetical protein